METSNIYAPIFCLILNALINHKCLVASHVGHVGSWVLLHLKIKAVLMCKINFEYISKNNIISKLRHMGLAAHYSVNEDKNKDCYVSTNRSLVPMLLMCSEHRLARLVSSAIFVLE